MLMYKELASAGKFMARIKLCSESTFGVRVVEELHVRYTSAHHLLERVREELQRTGINLVRWENMEFRLCQEGVLHEKCMWDGVQAR